MAQVLLFGVAALALVPHVAAYRDCYYDDYGNYYCNGLSNAARAGIGIGICKFSPYPTPNEHRADRYATFTVILFALILISVGSVRRRRIQAANKAYALQAQQQQQNGGYQPGYGPGPGQYRPNSGYGPGPGGPGYPQPAYGQQQPPGMYAPPPGAPPGFKGPDGQPQGPPPPQYTVPSNV
ncbi:hypothetical protein FRB94_008769 [Tulasnella sp. JGI-2019a]|nr:hypothetical protein FRB94_008769 [Tulasnella sp. JGI-2019a]